MNLEKFKPVNLTIGLPSVSITNNGVTFSKTAVVKLGAPEYAILLLNEEDKQFAVKLCDKADENSTQFVRNKKTLTVRYNNKDFLNTLEKLMGWDLSTQGHRANGEYYSDENLLLFDLTAARPITGRETEGDE